MFEASMFQELRRTPAIAALHTAARNRSQEFRALAPQWESALSGPRAIRQISFDLIPCWPRVRVAQGPNPFRPRLWAAQRSGAAINPAASFAALAAEGESHVL